MIIPTIQYILMIGVFILSFIVSVVMIIGGALLATSWEDIYFDFMFMRLYGQV